MKVRRYHFLFLLILTATIWFSHAARAQDEAEENRKYPLIAAYIYNFTQFTAWPDAAIKNPFAICIVGRDPFGSSLNPIKNKEVASNKITLRHYSGKDGASLSSCNVLFVSSSESGSVEAILAPLRGTPVLTMSDIDGFADTGGMVEFKQENGKVSIWISLPTVQAAGIAISSKLLSLVHIKE